MSIFQMKCFPHDIPRFKNFVDEGYVCIGWPNIENLENVTKEEIRDRLAKSYSFTGHKLGNALGQVNTFVNTMQTGDTVVIMENGVAYLGVVGNYYYEQKYDNVKDGMCHRRNVKWSSKVLIPTLSSGLQKLLSNRNTISQYPDSYGESGLDKILDSKSLASNVKLERLYEDALNILEAELKSEEPDRRLKAATEILRLKK